jgi:hypothetical protein
MDLNKGVVSSQSLELDKEDGWTGRQYVTVSKNLVWSCHKFKASDP